MDRKKNYILYKTVFLQTLKEMYAQTRVWSKSVNLACS